MAFVAMLSAMTVSAALDVGCPAKDAIVARLETLGVSVVDTDDVRILFFRRGTGRTAEIYLPGAVPRTLEHDGPDCSSLAEATIALLSVLLEKGDDKARSAPAPIGMPAAAASHPAFRGEAAIVVSRGIVAPLAAGATIGLAWRPDRWASLGLAFETWPTRDHAVNEGSVHVSASSLGAVGCLESAALRPFTTAACVRAHAVVYALSADGFPAVRATDRLLFAGAADVRASVPVTRAFGFFVTAGVWVPAARLEVAVRGAESGFTTASIAPRVGLGVELNR